MLIMYMSHHSIEWLIPLLIQIVSYMKILQKMGKNSLAGIIPVWGEKRMSEDLFRSTRAFWRPAILALAMFLTANYIGTDNEYGVIMILVALIVYGVFLIRLYSRLARQFGKGRLFSLGLILIPFLFLPILAFGKSSYLGKREFRPEKDRGPVGNKIRKGAVFVISAAELAALIAVCFLVTVIVHPFRPVTEYMMKDTISKLSSVTDSDEVVGREQTLGENYEEVVDDQRSRDYFFPDHSGHKKVVVMEYVIGSNLEDARGAASINIAQMKDATAKGDGLDFVMQAGGSKRWFTGGMEDASVGRYVVSGGKLETVEELDSSMCMSEPQNLTDFIVWTKENYPADRYMLVLWDHGGGFTSGYGSDDLNKRSGDSHVMLASEIINAVAEAGVKFDLIGFDACLMQNVEYANAFEPYADYYLASEETEPGTGWFYTSGFGKLAEDPTLSTEEFGKSMISAYDQCNRAYNDGKVQPENTLSLVDLTLVKPVYANLEKLYGKATAEIGENHAVYANMSAARSNAYQFVDDEQVDMVSYLLNLMKADYKDQVMTDAELEKIMTSVKACVVYRNSDSAEGVNGLSIDFPYKNLDMYKYEHRELKKVKYKTERKFFDTFCSIMASQRKTEEAESFLGFEIPLDYSNEEWYIKGFEDYDTADLFIDIPVKEIENGYLPELPEETWDTILDVTVSAYMVTEDGLMYIGREHFADEDEEGHPIVAMDDRWVNVSGHLACYETDDPLVTEEGTVYRGTVRGRLNGKENIVIHIEWDPVTEDSEEDPKGRVTGYSLEDEEESFFMKKGLEQFTTGDSIEFLFDFYDESGKLIKTDTYGKKLRIITDDIVTVKDEPFASGTELHYYGVLTDVYQRDLLTEEIREMVE